MAIELFGSAASCLHQSSLPSSGSAFYGNADECLIRRTAVVRTRMPGGVGGVASRGVPLSRLTERARCYACPGGHCTTTVSRGIIARFYRLIIGRKSAPSSRTSPASLADTGGQHRRRPMADFLEGQRRQRAALFVDAVRSQTA